MTTSGDDGIVVVGGQKGASAMRAAVRPVLRGRLGNEATLALVDYVDEAGRELKTDVLEAATERFGRMLAEESGRLRVLLAEETAKLRLEMGGLRLDMGHEIGSLKADMANLRSELIKWAFGFWVAQLGAVAALLALMLRGR